MTTYALLCTEAKESRLLAPSAIRMQMGRWQHLCSFKIHLRVGVSGGRIHAAGWDATLSLVVGRRLTATRIPSCFQPLLKVETCLHSVRMQGVQGASHQSLSEPIRRGMQRKIRCGSQQA